MEQSAPCFVWFRQDLRLSYNPALDAAIKTGRPLVCVYLWDPSSSYHPNPRQKQWIASSLRELDIQLRERKNRLVFLKGDFERLKQLICSKGCKDIFWNKRYTPSCLKEDEAIEQQFKQHGIAVHAYNSFLLNEPWEIKTIQGGFYQKFSPYAAAVLKKGFSFKGFGQLGYMFSYIKNIESDAIQDWHKELGSPDWTGFVPGERAAQKQLDVFMQNHLLGYSLKRDFPGEDATSHLSIYLHHGEISIQQVIERLEQTDVPEIDRICFIKELLWREFNYQLLYQFPLLKIKSFNKLFEKFPWKYDQKQFLAWVEGRTGYPLVDAGMNQLRLTGFIHNRVRMVTASFLTKHLGLDWTWGENWFYKHLLDADEANNAANWQWVAGSGADAAPFFRVFNPLLQAKKFDPNGTYIRQYITERRFVDASLVHLQASPQWAYSGCTAPLVEHEKARLEALLKYQRLKK